MLPDDDKARIRRAREDVLHGHDAAARAAFFAPDATNHGRPVGREGVRRAHAALFATFDAAMPPGR